MSTKKPPTPLPPVAHADGILPVKLLREHPDNPRKTFAESELAEMAASMKPPAGRVDQRLVVRPVGVPGSNLPPHFEDGAWHDVAYFECLDGHKRLRAAKLAGLKEVPVDVVELDDQAAYLLMIRAFSQRSDPPVSEQAAAFGRLAEKGMTAERIVQETGRSLSFVRAALRLARLPAWALAAVDRGVLPRATAELVARVPGAESRAKAAGCVLLGCPHPADLDDDWNDADTWGETVTSIGKGGPTTELLTFRETKELIRTHFTRELKQAPFDRKALYVVPEAGPEANGPHLSACEPCPDRAGNDAEATADGARADTCLNPDCYARKVQAYRAGVLADAADKHILDADLGVEGFDRPPRGWCRLDAAMDETELAAEVAAADAGSSTKFAGDKLKGVLGKFCPQKYVAFGRGGKAVCLVKTTEARRALVDAGVLARPEPRKKQAGGGSGARTSGEESARDGSAPEAAQESPGRGGKTTHPARGPRKPSSIDVTERAALLAAKVLGEYGETQFEGLQDLDDGGTDGVITVGLRLACRALAYDALQYGTPRTPLLQLWIPVAGEGRTTAADGKLIDDTTGTWVSSKCLAFLLVLAAAAELTLDGPNTDTARELLDFAELDWDGLRGQAERELVSGETAEEKVERAEEELEAEQQPTADEETGATAKPESQSPDEQHQTAAGTCRVCGCTEADCSGCVERTGRACSWVSEKQDLCSACLPLIEQDIGSLFVGPRGLADNGRVNKLSAAGVRCVGHALKLDPANPPKGVKTEWAMDVRHRAAEWVAEQLWPEELKSEPDLDAPFARPGEIVRTSYGTGPYVVKSISTNGKRNGRFKYSMTLRDAGGGTKQGKDSYLNDYQRQPDGRIVADNGDELIVLPIVAEPGPTYWDWLKAAGIDDERSNKELQGRWMRGEPALLDTPPASREPAYACEANKKQLGGGSIGKRAKPKKGRVSA